MTTEPSRVFAAILKAVQNLTKKLISEELEELTTRIETTLRPGVTPTMEDMFQALLKDPIWLTIVTHIKKTVEESCDALKSEVKDSLIELQEDVCIQMLSENTDTRKGEISIKPALLRHTSEKGRGRLANVRRECGEKNDGKNSPKPRCTTPTPSSSSPVGETRMDESWYSRNRGRKIKVFWPKDRQWYHGRIGEYIHEKKKCAVNYDDGDREELDLSKERYRFLSPTVSKNHTKDRVVILAGDALRPREKNSRPWKESLEDAITVYPNKKRKFCNKLESNDIKSSGLASKGRKSAVPSKDRNKSSKLTRKNSKQSKKPKPVLVQQDLPGKKSHPIIIVPDSLKPKKCNEKRNKLKNNPSRQSGEDSAAIGVTKKTETVSNSTRTDLPAVEDESKEEFVQGTEIVDKKEQTLAPKTPLNCLNFVDWVRVEGPEKAVDARVAAFIGQEWKDGIVVSLGSSSTIDSNLEISVLLDLEGDETIHKVPASLVWLQPTTSCPNIGIEESCQAKDIDEWFSGQVKEIRQGVKDPVVKVMFVIPDEQSVYQWFKSSLIRMHPQTST